MGRGEQYAYFGISPLSSSANIYYTPTTYAIRSVCRPITREFFSKNDLFGIGAIYSIKEVQARLSILIKIGAYSQGATGT